MYVHTYYYSVSNTTDCLAVCSLPTIARMCHKFDEVHLHLVSVPNNAPTNVVHFVPSTVTVTKNGQTLLKGTKDPTRNLYMIPLHVTLDERPGLSNIEPTVIAANAYDITQRTQQLAFLHASVGYPTHSTFFSAV